MTKRIMNNITSLSFHLIKLLLTVLVVIPSSSKALDFTLQGRRFEILELDLGKQLGCAQEQIIAVILQNSDGEEIWASKSIAQVKRDLMFQGKCTGGNVDTIKGVWTQPDWVHFIVLLETWGASGGPGHATVYQFDGRKVIPVFEFEEYEYGLSIQFKPPIITATYYKWEKGECHACPHRWIRETFKWDGNTYRMIKREVSKKKSINNPYGGSAK